jgi:glycosyltransferase involved in cell wall biosynthesis
VKGLSKHPGIIVAGRIEDLRLFFSRAALAVVPIRVAGGTRIKILEAAAHGVPIVTTSVGVAGTGLRHRHELLVADHERAFAAACVRMLTDRNFAYRMARHARRQVRREYNPRHCARRFYSLLNTATACGSSLCLPKTSSAGFAVAKRIGS